MTTTASGRLVDDPSGAPLGGVNVALAPWIAGAAPIPEGTTAPDGSFSFTAPNGHYLLYIGSNASSDTTRPTIHDNITLAGGAQALKAPTLPPIPLVTPSATETNGSYRLLTLDTNTEVPCFTSFNALRSSNFVPEVVEDEWLSENSRSIVQMSVNPAYHAGLTDPRNPFGYLTTSNVGISGGADCPSSLVPQAFSGGPPYFAKNSFIQWFGGDYVRFFNPEAQATGEIEFPQDPRGFSDPNTTPPVWP
ncbi:MAG: carboxypeptidase-like regulatory domain-containing protein [Candidatus Eremiobacteraeota bacterium]|nr:carboxypeptidase-like regulatory domain-containing protein [Candidatus Eremiobacteraeota bacterium]